MNNPTIGAFGRQGILSSLIWYPEHGMGYYPVVDSPYDQNYWDKYVGYANSETGKSITKDRISWVDRWIDSGHLTDIGIGCGHFITERNRKWNEGVTTGFDINPVGIDWLKSNILYSDPYKSETESVSLWDVLEHIHDPGPLLLNVKRYVFATIPIFHGPDQILRSKHFRRDEHCWYWTKDSFPVFMSWFGFRLLDRDDFEVRSGREDVMTFAFERI